MYVLAFIIATLMLWVLLYVTVDGIQRYIYDGTVSHLVWRALGAAAGLGLLLTVFPMDWAGLMEFPVLTHLLAWVLAFRLIFFLPTRTAILSALPCAFLYCFLTTLTFYSITGVGVR